MKAEDDKELIDQIRKSKNSPSRDFEEVCKDLDIPPEDK